MCCARGKQPLESSIAGANVYQSWCQVAVEAMAVNSLILGVDLVPIKPIPRTTTFQGDITSDKCRATIRQHFKTWKADTVLHDGAPNVGTAWVQDAFSQAELALQALKLASEFLVEGGTFVTKVFRSKDYNALLWACNQLFSKVEATKPPSSRNVSAEIYVVCRGFKAPKRIDPRLLEPRSVFAEIPNPTPNHEAKVFNPEKKKRKREGYEEGDYTQFREAPASQFVKTADPISMLGSMNRFGFAHSVDDDMVLAALDQLPETTLEIKHCCEDLKVLGRKEFRMLLRWRMKAREKFGLASKTTTDPYVSEEVTEIAPIDEELQIQNELQKLEENHETTKKKERRKANEKKHRETVRMQLNMLPPTEIGLEQAGPNGEDSMFALAAVNRARAIEKISKGGMGTAVRKASQSENESQEDGGTDDEEDGLEWDLDALYEQYQRRKSEIDARYRAKKARAERASGEWTGITESVSGSDEGINIDQLSATSSSGRDETDPISQGHNTTRFYEPSGPLTDRAALFFDQDVFRDIGVLDTVQYENEGCEVADDTPNSKYGVAARGVARTSTKPHSIGEPKRLEPHTKLQLSTLPTCSAQETYFQALEPKPRSHEVTTKDTAVQDDNDGRGGKSEPQKNGRLSMSPCFDIFLGI